MDAQYTQVITLLPVTPFTKLQLLYSTRLVLTTSILRKNRCRHPEMDGQYNHLPLVCRDPDLVCRNRRDPEIAVCHRAVEGKRLRVTIWLKQASSPPSIHSSILSFRWCHAGEWEDEKRRGRIVYSRGDVRPEVNGGVSCSPCVADASLGRTPKSLQSLCPLRGGAVPGDLDSLERGIIS